MFRVLLRPCLLAAALVIAGAAALAADGYLSAIPDLPLMPGLEEVPDSGLVFDKPGGRIVEAYAAGRTTVEAVRRFYAETLPQLGWQPLHAGGFLREGERLSLEVEQRAAEVTVLYRLSPQ